LPLHALAQDARNPINLTLKQANRDGEQVPIQKVNFYTYKLDKPLDLDDSIRFGWNNISLDVNSRDNPNPNKGYLKVYVGSVKPDNLATYAGSNSDIYPLKISAMKDHLEPGKNKVIFVYENSYFQEPKGKVTFTFNFENQTSSPKIKVLEPAPETVFMESTARPIKLELLNFKLEKSFKKREGYGSLKVYYNKTSEDNLLKTVTSGNTSEKGTFLVELNPNNLKLSQIADSKDTKLIFQLVDNKGNPLDISPKELPIITNYNQSLDVDLPQIKILEPSKNRTDLTVYGDTKFAVKVDNFKLLESTSTQSEGPVTNTKGYLQILIGQEEVFKPIQTVWGKQEFTLNQIDYTPQERKRQIVKVKLVNRNFEDLKPPAMDTVEVVYEPEVVTAEETDNITQNNTWRFVIIGLTILLIISGISILITKG
jgi:hypothetical protein